MHFCLEAGVMKAVIQHRHDNQQCYFCGDALRAGLGLRTFWTCSHKAPIIDEVEARLKTYEVDAGAVAQRGRTQAQANARRVAQQYDDTVDDQTFARPLPRKPQWTEHPPDPFRARVVVTPLLNLTRVRVGDTPHDKRLNKVRDVVTLHPNFTKGKDGATRRPRSNFKARDGDTPSAGAISVSGSGIPTQMGRTASGTGIRSSRRDRQRCGRPPRARWFYGRARPRRDAWR